MLKPIDRLLNGITMYRLVLYYLIFLLGTALLFSYKGYLPYDPFALLFTTTFLVTVCWLTNFIFARTFQVPANVESVYISALLLALIITPIGSPAEIGFLIWAGVWAMASKYILAINRNHIFNPAAFAVALTAITLNQTASWWVGSPLLLPFVVVGGLLIVRKTRKWEAVVSFLSASMVVTLAFTLIERKPLVGELQNTLLYSPWLFFAFLFITEPLTLPPTAKLQAIYGAIVGFLFSPFIHLGTFYLTPELALLCGNIFSYIVRPKAKASLKLQDKIQIAPDIYDFIFLPNKRFSFMPGQYMEWTLGHNHPDSRGNRRYFTLASSPTERELRVGVRFYPNSSTYKQSMLNMDVSSQIVAAQLAGDFVLPADKNQKCVFIAGGIGITPFRSMLKYMLDKWQRRPIVVFYSNRTADEIVYRDVLDDAQKKLRVKVNYVLTDRKQIPPNWRGKVGRITEQMIKDEVPDYTNCMFYLSGPNAMVTEFEETLRKMGIDHSHIKTDFFPGFA